MDYITDLGHFLDDRGEIPGAIPKKARELASFLALIVDACTLAESRWDRSRATGISCREPGCRGAVEAAIRLSDDRIRWACTDCDSNGLISGWRGTRWDNFRHHDADGDLESGWHDADDDLPDGFPEDDGPIEFPGPMDGSGPAVDLFNAFLAAHPGGTFESMTELNAQYADFVDDRNRLPEPDFAGLSRHEIHGLMYYPFDSPDTIRFLNEIPADADAPILTVLRAAVDEIAGAGLKPTATGAFQTAFVRRIAPLIWSESCELLQYDPHRVRREANVRDLHRIRLILEMAGILRTYRGRFIIGQEFRSRIARGGASAVYPDILRTYARRYNWGYDDRLPKLSEIQHFFGFSLYLLARFGDEERPSDFYADAFARAFPLLLTDPVLLADARGEPEDRFRLTYTHRTLNSFLRLLGLVEVRKTSGRTFPLTFAVRARPLLSDVVIFQVG